jgi:hypothetical protein
MKAMTHSEGELFFDFSAARSVNKPDEPHLKKPEGWKLVDFVIEEEDRLVLVEIKDPSCEPKADTPEAQEHVRREREDFAKKIASRTWIAQDLTPKARNSYSLLHLMKRDDKPMLYVILLGAAKLSLDLPLLLAFKERLLDGLRQEVDTPWPRQYVTDCLVLTETSWSRAFPGYPLVRRPRR